VLLAALAVGATPPALPAAPPITREVIDVDGAPSRGPANAPVTIVEFADFQCPFCAQGARTLRRLQNLYPTQVRLVFKHFPLRGSEGSRLAHEASVAAEAQGKFWEMYTLLMANQTAHDRESLLGYADELGLDRAAFRNRLEEQRQRGRVLRDVIEGRRLGVIGTPTYFVNGRRLVGARGLGEFRSLVDEELAAAAAPAADR
jgi:protein-disulfide isomerase